MQLVSRSDNYHLLCLWGFSPWMWHRPHLSLFLFSLECIRTSSQICLHLWFYIIKLNALPTKHYQYLLTPPLTLSTHVSRLDTTLIDFTDMKCQRGDLSFIFNGNAIPSESFVVLDNEQKVYQRIHHEVRGSSACGVSCCKCCTF